MNVLLCVFLLLSHMALFYNGYIGYYYLFILLTVDMLMFLPMLLWNKFSKKTIYIAIIFLLFILNSITLINNNLINIDFGLIIFTLIIFIPPIFIKRTNICLLYIATFGYFTQSATNYDILLINELNIHYYPTALYMLFYIPLLKILKIEEQFPKNQKIYFIIGIIILGAILQLNNAVGISILMSMLLNAIPEELIFRAWTNYELGNFITNNQVKTLLSSTFFTIIHIPILLGEPFALGNYLYVFLLGIALAHVYSKTKNIILPSLIHTALNSVIFLINAI